MKTELEDKPTQKDRLPQTAKNRLQGTLTGAKNQLDGILETLAILPVDSENTQTPALQ
jgi:hypothetical protein